MFTVTPMRNGLTLGATSPLPAGTLYKQVFSRGLAGGWTGGIYPAMAACPQFLCLGPAYHLFASFGGVTGGVMMASILETGIVYGAETANAQMAKNSSVPGSFKNVHPSWKPFGPGVGWHILRNVVATAGLRMFCGPCTWAVESATGKKNGLTQLGGDFLGNVGGACLTAPIHQLYGFSVTTPEMATLSMSEKQARCKQFLKEQYLVTEGGKTSLSKLVPRDLFMRSMYVAVAYTMFSTIERTLISIWPK
jgi:hypothetical protein